MRTLCMRAHAYTNAHKNTLAHICTYMTHKHTHAHLHVYSTQMQIENTCARRNSRAHTHISSFLHARARVQPQPHAHKLTCMRLACCLAIFHTKERSHSINEPAYAHRHTHRIFTLCRYTNTHIYIHSHVKAPVLGMPWQR